MISKILWSVLMVLCTILGVGILVIFFALTLLEVKITAEDVYTVILESAWRNERQIRSELLARKGIREKKFSWRNINPAKMNYLLTKLECDKKIERRRGSADLSTPAGQTGYRTYEYRRLSQAAAV